MELKIDFVYLFRALKTWKVHMTMCNIQNGAILAKGEEGIPEQLDIILLLSGIHIH